MMILAATEEDNRRVATCYEKTARNFLAYIHVASIILLLQ
jgi:hypothetical protein